MRRPRRVANDDPPPPPPTLAATRLAALRMLGRRDYTTSEITSRLADRGHLDEHTQSVVARLVADGSIDDARVAAAHVRTGSRIKGRGRLRIQRELEMRGVPKSDARDALDQISAADELEAIAKFIARKRLPAVPSLAERRRLFQQLIRRGFRADAIGKVLKGGIED